MKTIEELEELNRESNWLIYKYNELLLDKDIKDKNQVREWFYAMIQPLIINGVPSYNFLYCESTLLPIESIRDLYKITDEDEIKYRKKYVNLDWFDKIKKYNYE